MNFKTTILRKITSTFNMIWANIYHVCAMLCAHHSNDGTKINWKKSIMTGLSAQLTMRLGSCIDRDYSLCFAIVLPAPGLLANFWVCRTEHKLALKMQNLEKKSHNAHETRMVEWLIKKWSIAIATDQLFTFSTFYLASTCFSILCSCI